jgi:hypothetical protein
VDDTDVDSGTQALMGNSSSSSSSSSSSKSNINNNNNICCSSSKGSMHSSGTINMIKGVPLQTLDLSYIEFITIAPADGDTETERERERERENLELGMESGKARHTGDSISGSSSRMSGPGSCGTAPLLQCTNLTGERVGLIA